MSWWHISRSSKRAYVDVRESVYLVLANAMNDDRLPIASLRDRVYALMSKLPDDKVTTYGDLAALAGHPYAARREIGRAHV